MPESVADRLRALIAKTGPISVGQYMAEANRHYYATRDPLGANGDFTTAPEVSQMFGELIGICLADLWARAGKPAVRYVELGPGRGTLAADALRVMAGSGLRPEVAFVEMSPVLRAAQAERVPQAMFHEDPAKLPDDLPMLVVANEFFDALPIHQLVAGDGGWRELRVAAEGDSFRRVPGDVVPAPLPEAPQGTIQEVSPAAVAVMRDLARRIAAQGGAAIVIDYGNVYSAPGDTLQAVASHAFADPLADPGERDLTAHVDFQALAHTATKEGARVLGPVAQGALLDALGIDVRAASLVKAAPDKAAEIDAAVRRLIAPEQMGVHFMAMAVVGPDWPDPAGFA